MNNHEIFIVWFSVWPEKKPFLGKIPINASIHLPKF